MGLPTVSGLLLPLVFQVLLVAVPTSGDAGWDEDNLCPQGKYPHPENSSICCTKCHKGTFLKNDCKNSWMSTDCEVCPEGTYSAHENYHPNCFDCSYCDTFMNQVEISPCKKDEDTVCGCLPNHYRHDMGNVLFCEPCSSCANGTVIRPCQENHDTLCTCDGGFYLNLKDNKCLPCSKCKNGSECTKTCFRTSGSKKPEERTTEVLLPLVIFFGLCVLFLLLLVFLCRSPRWKSKLTSIVCPGKLSTSIKEGEPDPEKSGPAGPYPPPPFSPIRTFSSPAPFTTSESWSYFGPPFLQTAPPLLTASPAPGAPDLTSSLLPKVGDSTPQQHPDSDDPATLYAVVDGVPPSRWREFVRRLGLSEHEIERLELQNGRCLREAQYSMLAAWRHRMPRNEPLLELLERVLGDMDLRGCLEDIQEALQNSRPRPPR